MNIVITGPSGSGKSTLAKMLGKRINAKICEVDLFFRESFLEQKELMISKLGENCISTDGSVNFGLLSLLSPEKDLEIRMLLSESMNRKILNEINKSKLENKHIIFDYLFITDCQALINADLIVYIKTPIEIRYKRMLSRSKERFKFTKEQFVAMDNLTNSTIKNFKPNFVIDNSLNKRLEEQVDKIVKFIK